MQDSLVPEARLSIFALDCVYQPNYGFARVVRQIPLVQQSAQTWPQCAKRMLSGDPAVFCAGEPVARQSKSRFTVVN
jgi:hypothetical protein